MSVFPAHTDEPGVPLQARADHRPGFARSGREHAWAAGLLALVLLAYLWPALIEGKVLTAASSLYGLAPWNAFAPHNLSHFYNQLLIDEAKAHYPWDLYDRRAIGHGVFPSWNPLVLSGTPYYANSQSGVTSLFNIPLWILPLNYGLGLTRVPQLWADFGGQPAESACSERFC